MNEEEEEEEEDRKIGLPQSWWNSPVLVSCQSSPPLNPTILPSASPVYSTPTKVKGKLSILNITCTSLHIYSI